VRRLLRRAVIAVVIVAAAIAVVLAIAQDQQTLQIRSAVAADETASVSYIAALVGAPVSRGDTFDVLRNGDQIFPAMLAAIDAARERISFETYIFEDGSVADRFATALLAARQRGVTVNMVVDFVGASAMSDHHVKTLRQAGCQMSSYNSPKWYELEEVNYRTHRKILVVDGDVAFIGGAGIADHWLGDAQDAAHWRDTHVRIRGPLARLIEAAFYENFVEGGGVKTPALDPPAGRPETAESGGAESMLLRSAATGGSNDLKRLYLLLIASAKRSVDITTPYFITDESTLWALEDASHRGVRVRILTEGDVTDARPVKYSSRRNYEKLLERGIELYEYQPTMMHSKALVVDSVWTMFGSANMDNRSLELNDELNVAVRSADVSSRFAAMFEEDLRRAERLQLDAWRERPITEKVKEHFWGVWGEIF
jgi:cardiolipin synthase A/B